MVNEAPQFFVCEVGPGPRSTLWLYATVGASELRDGPGGLEFILACPSQCERGVELATMAARYHRRQGLGMGHTCPIGEPWLPGAACHHILVTFPYPWGPALEVVPYGDSHIHVLWLLPITAAERAYKAEHGQEALEALFEAKKLEYWKIDRDSLVPG